MKKQKGIIRIGSIIIIIILLIILVNFFKVYKANYFSGFEKATVKQVGVKFIRDSEIKYSDSNSYKIENLEYNDSTFYREIEVEPNTPYRISCMVKTQNVECETANESGGALIGLLDTVEYSKPITGTNDWQPMEFIFDSKNRDKVKISFRLGGNENNCSGTVWFSDLKLEKGIKDKTKNWKVGCFIIKELNVDIDGHQYDFKVNSEDIKNVELNMKRYQEDCYEFSNRAMNVQYDIVEVDTPITSISYSDEHGYYVSYKDVEDAIYDIIQEKQYDHVFVVCRMEDELGNETIPIYDNWIGLGGMDIYGVGYSLIRINKNGNTYTYKYGITNKLPEEAYVHEFLHTLERNMQENGYEIPELHAYEKYGYTVEAIQGLKEWYIDYMNGEIYDRVISNYVGLNDFAYNTQPPHIDNFKYAQEEELYIEPQNIIEEVKAIVDVLIKR